MAARTKGRRAQKADRPAGKVRRVVYLTPEADRQWGLACLAERMRRGPWLERMIGHAARRYVLSVRGVEDGRNDAAA
jgi:hypothetical protein